MFLLQTPELPGSAARENENVRNKRFFQSSFKCQRCRLKRKQKVKIKKLFLNFSKDYSTWTLKSLSILSASA
jgi:hypothetical protein